MLLGHPSDVPEHGRRQRCHVEPDVERDEERDPGVVEDLDSFLREVEQLGPLHRQTSPGRRMTPDSKVLESRNQRFPVRGRAKGPEELGEFSTGQSGDQ